MGYKWITFYQNKVKKNWKIAFASAFVMGLLVHLYKFTNNLPYFDGLYNAYSSQNMVASGRWFLSIACMLSSYFDLPWLIGVLSVFVMALTMIVVTDVLDIQNPCLIVVSSGLLVSFPAITETMFFEYTADGYMIAMLFSSLAVYCSRMEQTGGWKAFLLSAVLICLTCGIYQAYLSFALVLAICYFLGILLENRYCARMCWKWVLFQAGIYVTGLLLYYLLWQILLRVQGAEAASYQGINSMGISIGQLLSAAKNSFVSFVWFLLERDPRYHGWSTYSVLSCLSCVAFFLVFGISVFKSGIYRRVPSFLLAVLCVAVIPFACYLCYFVTPGTSYYTRMLQSVVLLFLFTGVLCERWAGPALKQGVLLLLIAVFFHNSVMANVCYTYLDRSYEKSYATMVELSTRIHLEDDGTAKYIAFVGTFDRLPESADVDDAQLGTLGPLKLACKAALFYYDHMMLFMDQYTDFTLEYYRTSSQEFPEMEIAPGSPVPADYSFRFPYVEQERQYQILALPEVADMGIWPGRDSVKRIADTIVVKLSNE